MTMQAPPAVSIVPHSLQAVCEKQPGQPCAFHVTVDVEVDSGCMVDLVPSAPQGINPLIKLLRFKVVPTAGAPGTLARRSVRYSETPPGATYTEVWLGEGDRAISARVKTVT